MDARLTLGGLREALSKECTSYISVDWIAVNLGQIVTQNRGK